MSTATAWADGDTLNPGDVQYMSAGQGVLHSEYNPSAENGAHFLQVWIQPDRNGYAPRYEKLPGILDSARNEWIPVLKPEGEDGDGIAIRQAARSWFSNLDTGSELSREVVAGRGLWIQVIEGVVSIDGEGYEIGDALAVSGPAQEVVVEAKSAARLIAFEVPLAE